MRRTRLWGIALVAAVVALGAVGGVAAQGGPEEPQAAAVEVTVWRRVSNPSLLYVSTRPEGGSWRTLNTPLDMSQRSDSGRFHQSNAIVVQVRLDDGTTVGVEVTVWRRISNPSLLYVSTRPEGGSWRTLNTALDMSQRSDSGRFHQSNAVLVDVPLPEPEPELEPAPADRSECRIDETTAARVIASTVQVITPSGTGSAFYVGNSEFVTAAHVVEDGPSWITLRNASHSVSARLVGLYPFESGDIAILSASAQGMASLEWAGTLAPGASVAVFGYPKSLGVDASITRGVVSRLFTQQGISYIQTDAASNPGNSGGPLVDACGRVAGVISFAYRDTEGLHFAVAEPTLGRLLEAIRSGQSPPPVEKPPPDSVDPGEPTFWQINELINSVSEEWGPTITALNALVEQWDIIDDYEDPPSDRLAANARERADLSRAMVGRLTALRSDSATRNTTASSYLEAAIAYWSENAAEKAALETYAFNTATWAVVQRSQATKAAAWASYTRARCDLWRLQGYSNAEDICTEADATEGAAEEAAAAAEEREAWEEIDSLRGRVAEHWAPTTNALSAVVEQWNATIDTVNRPSTTLAGIARQQRVLTQGMVSRLVALRSDAALENGTVSWYLEAAITYWSAYRRKLPGSWEQYALGAGGPARALERAQEAQRRRRLWTTYATSERAVTSVQLQEYLNADEVCSQRRGSSAPYQAV